METSSSPAPVRRTLVPIKLHYKLGTLIGYSSTTSARLKEIGKSPSKLKAFQARNPSLAELSRITDAPGAKGAFRPGCSPIDDIRAAMQAGDVELFFIVLTLYRSNALRGCLQDPTIAGIIREWEKDTDSGNQDARALLIRIGTALGRASYRRPPLPATEPRRVHQDASSNSKAVARLLKRFQAEVGDGRSPQHAYENTVRNYCESSRMTEARKDFALAAFDKKVMALHPGLHSLVGRTIWRTWLSREG